MVSYSLENFENKIIGGITGYSTLNLFFISNIFVEEEYRGKGLGKKLMLEIENSAKELGCNILRLNTFNKKTDKFYLDVGYKQTIIIKNYMDDFDLIYYEKVLV